MRFVFDTNAISDLGRFEANVTLRFDTALLNADEMFLPSPIYFEIVRGLLWRYSLVQLKTFQERWLPAFILVNPTFRDWYVASQIWAEARRAGRQLSDVDVLLVAIARRLDAILVTADDDFDALHVQRENWRIS